MRAIRLIFTPLTKVIGVKYITLMESVLYEYNKTNYVQGGRAES